MDHGRERRTDWVDHATVFKQLLLGSQSRAQQHVFFAQRAVSLVPGVDMRKAIKVKKVGIIGAGTMGGGIAMCFIEACQSALYAACL